MVALGVNQAACANIGQAIGNEDVQKAKAYFHVSNIVATSFFLIVTLVFYFYRFQMLQVFSTNVELLDKARSVIFIFTIQVLPDLWQGYMQGPIKALGL